MRADKLADRVKAPWRMAVVLVSVTAGASFALWVDAQQRRLDELMRYEEPLYVHVKLRPSGLSADANAAAFQSSVPAFISTEGEPLEALSVEPLFVGLPDAIVDRDDDRARWLRIRVPSRAEAERWVSGLPGRWDIDQAFIEPEATLAEWIDVGDNSPHYIQTGDDSCPLTTPSFESYQGYLGPAPHGIDAPAAWRRGARGQGVWFADVEGGWNSKHEDLHGDRITHVVGKPINDRSWRAHGTAVLGEVVGKDNGKGVVGIAPDVDRVFTASIGGTSVANAIDTAARKLRPGDVLLIELQTTGPRGRYIPVEWYDDVYDAIAAATKRGVVIVEAAGNGAEDLDHDIYKGKFDRSKRDSGAIMIGAGGPPRDGFKDRERLDFSNYGGRVDVQGWGRKVATLDYGDLQSCDDDSRDRHYTDFFSGTSSASPIVAGAAVLLEGMARERGKVIPPRELRELLRKTGTPQAGNTKEHIGPRPNLARAIAALAELDCPPPAAPDGVCRILFD